MQIFRPLLRQSYLAPGRRANNEALWQAYEPNRGILGINIGSGTALKREFLNCDLNPQYNDVFALDVTQPFPWHDNTFDYVFSEHMFEHISFGQGGAMLAECFRVLKPGGVIRLVTPSIEFLFGLFNPATQTERDYVVWAQRLLTPGAPAPLAAFVFNTFVRSWGHTFIYDRPSLRLALERAHFSAIEEQKISVSPHPFLNNLEAVYRMPPGFLELESMIFEATKR